MTIIFAGTPEFAATSLKALLEAGHPVTAVYTQPDRPAGRGRKTQYSDVKKVALEHELPVFQPSSFKDQDALATLEALKPDLMIVAAYGLILPRAVLDIPRLGCVNIHGSLLPRWRGAAPIQRAIEAGDTETGITIMRMDEGLDTGDMLWKKTIAIAPDETGGTLHDKLARLGAEAMLEALPGILNGTLSGTPQDNALATYAHKLTKEEGRIDWTQSAEVILRKIRALNPWPVAFTVQEDTPVRIFDAIPGESCQAPPGKVLFRDKSGVGIACKTGSIVITSLQLPGSKRVTGRDFANGHHRLLTPDTMLD